MGVAGHFGAQKFLLQKMMNLTRFVIYCLSIFESHEIKFQQISSIFLSAIFCPQIAPLPPVLTLLMCNKEAYQLFIFRRLNFTLFLTFKSYVIQILEHKIDENALQ